MKSITLVATASVALIKFEDLINKLRKEKYEVNVVATPSALEYFPDLNKMLTLDINKYLKGPTEHVNLSIKTDLFVVAPATANTISKFVAGFADSMALSSLLAAKQKILWAPAMNDKMLEGIIQRDHIKWLEENGHFIIGPNYGMLREGYEAWGRMSEPEEIVEVIKNILNPVKDKKVIVSYGASREFIDPVRFVTNYSSGRFGKLILKNLRLLGVNAHGIDAANHGHEEIFEEAKDAYIYVSAAALSDFKFKKVESKIKKGSGLTLVGKPTLDVITKLSKESNVKIVGFKADESKENAITKMKQLNLEMMVWNKLGTMSSDKVKGCVLQDGVEVVLNSMNKYDAAKLIAQMIKEKLL